MSPGFREFLLVFSFCFSWFVSSFIVVLLILFVWVQWVSVQDSVSGAHGHKERDERAKG